VPHSDKLPNAGAKPMSDQEGTAMKKLNILVVDDEPSVCEVIQERLEIADYQVETAENGEEATDLITRHHYDVVLTDLKMPGEVDGIGVLEAAKARNINTEVILITGHGSVDNAVKAMKKGANDYLRKPINLGELVLRLEKISNIRDLGKHASDLREAMNVTEEAAAQTISDLELMVSELKDTLRNVKEVLSNPDMDPLEQIQTVLKMLPDPNH